MRFTLVDPSSNRPHIAIIGVWDPPRPEHCTLLGQLAHEAAVRGLAALVVTLTPPPASYLYGTHKWPVHSDLRYRQSVQRAAGVGSRVTVEMSQDDIHRDAEHFLTGLCEALPVAELWLGARQSFGRYAPGSQNAIKEFCQQHEIEYRKLPPSSEQPPSPVIRDALGAGRIRDVRQALPTPPIWCRPDRDVLRFAWAPGVYEIVSHGGDIDRDIA
jgi:FAD synthase